MRGFLRKDGRKGIRNLLVVAYLVLVGPVNYFVLRRLDMRALSIVTIPMLSAVFVLLNFAAGYLSRGVNTVGRRVTVAAAGKTPW